MAAEIEQKIRANAGLLADDMISPPKTAKNDDEEEGSEENIVLQTSE